MTLSSDPITPFSSTAPVIVSWQQPSDSHATYAASGLSPLSWHVHLELSQNGPAHKAVFRLRIPVEVGDRTLDHYLYFDPERILGLEVPEPVLPTFARDQECTPSANVKTVSFLLQEVSDIFFLAPPPSDVNFLSPTPSSELRVKEWISTTYPLYLSLLRTTKLTISIPTEHVRTGAIESLRSQLRKGPLKTAAELNKLNFLHSASGGEAIHGPHRDEASAGEMASIPDFLLEQFEEEKQWLSSVDVWKDGAWQPE